MDPTHAEILCSTVLLPALLAVSYLLRLMGGYDE